MRAWITDMSGLKLELKMFESLLYYYNIFKRIEAKIQIYDV